MPLLIMPNLATMKPAPTNTFRWAPLPYGMDGWMDGWMNACMDGWETLFDSIHVP
jgi:hypothetical protein